MYDDKLHLYMQIIKSQNINIILLEDMYQNLSFMDMGLRQKIYKNYDYSSELELIENVNESDSVISIKDEFLLNYLLINIKNEVYEDKHHKIIIGPFILSQIKDDSIVECLRNKKIPLEWRKDLREFYNTLPMYESIKSISDWILSISSNIFERSFELKLSDENDIRVEPLEVKDSIEKEYELQEELKIAVSNIEKRYEIEEEFLEAVSVGDYKKCMERFEGFKLYRVSPRSLDNVKNEQNLLIILNTLCRKKLQYANNIHPLYLDDLSTKIAIKINQINTVDEIEAVRNEIIRKYCILAKNYSMRGYSHIVKQAVVYIDFHFAEELSLSKLAKILNISKSYLANIFKKETGNRVTDYLHSVRMRRAIMLLNSTNLDIGMISHICGYNDENYFIRIFKRINNNTPKQYRLLIKK